MANRFRRNGRIAKFFLLTSVLATLGCTGQLPGSFRFVQQKEDFKTAQDVNTKIDLLWVVDNSSSMDVHQQKLRAGFQGFAAKYMKPTWDIRVAVITTDTYMAHPDYATYLNTTITVPNTVGAIDLYLRDIPWLSTYKMPFGIPNFVDQSAGASKGTLNVGVKYGQMVPAWGPQYARLKPGIHDGPITTLCWEGAPYFWKGTTKCNIRDNYASYPSAENCVTPGVGEFSLSQCVNTVQNDTVRSGKAIISTTPPAGTAGDSAWTAKLIHDFIINASVGNAGSGSERGLNSVLQLLTDNETSDTAFFRPGSLRGIIFLTDEDDQSLRVATPLFTANYTAPCGTSKTVDAHTYTLSRCVDPSQLVAVSDVKAQLDEFFRKLDKLDSTGNPNYFTTVITPTTGASIAAIQLARKAEDTTVINVTNDISADRGDRYLLLGTLVGNGSLSQDIGLADYSPVLDAIGKSIVTKKSTFILGRAPTGAEDMIVMVIHADRSSEIIPSSQFTISGKTLTFTNQEFVLSLASTDKISIDYQPKTGS